MSNPFKALKSDAKSPEEKEYHAKIQKLAMKIAGKSMIGKLKAEDVDKLESLYTEYFEKFPDKDRELSSRLRIDKLRRIV